MCHRYHQLVAKERHSLRVFALAHVRAHAGTTKYIPASCTCRYLHSRRCGRFIGDGDSPFWSVHNLAW